MEGEPKFERSQSLPDFQYAQYAEMIGLAGVRIESPGDVDAAWDAAFSADRPFVIDAVVNADVPTLPPWLRDEQEKKFEAALAAGDPDAAGVREQLERQDIHGEEQEHERRQEAVYVAG